MRTSQLFHKPLQPFHLGSASSTIRGNTYPLMDAQFKWNLSLFVCLVMWVSFIFSWKHCLFKQIMRKSKRWFHYSLIKARGLGCERNGILATPETKAAFRQWAVRRWCMLNKEIKERSLWLKKDGVRLGHFCQVLKGGYHCLVYVVSKRLGHSCVTDQLLCSLKSPS